MNAQQFWSIIAAAAPPTNKRTDRAWFKALKDELTKLPPDEIVLFRREFDANVGAAYKIDLWGAAYLINGGCSDDGFHYFRCWLVGMGRTVYERALADPDSLADILDGDETAEPALDSAPKQAWQEKTGRTEAEFYQELDRLTAGDIATALSEGDDWDFDDDDEVRRRLPRLFELYVEE